MKCKTFWFLWQLLAIAALTTAGVPLIQNITQNYEINSTENLTTLWRNQLMYADGNTNLISDNLQTGEVVPNVTGIISLVPQSFRETSARNTLGIGENNPLPGNSQEPGDGENNSVPVNSQEPGPGENNPAAVNSQEPGDGENNPAAVNSQEPGDGENNPAAVNSQEPGDGENNPAAVNSQEPGDGENNPAAVNSQEPGDGENNPAAVNSQEPGDGENNSVAVNSQEPGTGENNPEAVNSQETGTGGSDGNEENNLPDTSNEDFQIETEKGPVRGFLWQESSEIVAYYDIPYGRFQSLFAEPSEAESWQEIREVKEHEKRCPQLEGTSNVGSTDCLTLSIFAPIKAVNRSVLFHIHESDFTSGSGDPAIYGPDYLVTNDVILVLPNYRLGPLGFLCLKNSTIPGNAALKDLALALQWIKDNIYAFGGDPYNIAVSGDGTSAALAGYLALSSQSRHLFNKVITDSGSVLSHWAIDRNPSDTVAELIEHIRNNTDQNLGEDILGIGNLERILLSARHIHIRPCIEDDGFLIDTPWNILQNLTLNETNFLIGSANHAGLLEALRHDQASIEQLNRDFTGLLPNDLVFSNANERNEIVGALRRQYFGDSISLARSEELSLFHTDASYLGPSIRVARALNSVGATVFLYEFSFVGSLNRELEALGNIERPGAVRGDIIGYLFTQDARQQEKGTSEKQMVDLMVELWANFVKTGAPTSPGITWEPLQATAEAQESWLHINATPTTVTGVHPDRMTLWTRVYRDHFVDTNSGDLSATANYLIAAVSCLLSFTKFV